MSDSFSTKIRRLNKSFSALAKSCKSTNAKSYKSTDSIAFVDEDEVINDKLTRFAAYFSHSPQEFEEFWQIYADFLQERYNRQLATYQSRKEKFAQESQDFWKKYYGY